MANHRNHQQATSNYFLSGKSTIAALIERFYDIDGGCVTIDGVDIKDLDPSWLRGELIGYINQVIFYGLVICLFATCGGWWM